MASGASPTGVWHALATRPGKLDLWKIGHLPGPSEWRKETENCNLETNESVPLCVRSRAFGCRFPPPLGPWPAPPKSPNKNSSSSSPSHQDFVSSAWISAADKSSNLCRTSEVPRLPKIGVRKEA